MTAITNTSAYAITWTARNNSSFLNGERHASTIRAAVRAARHYLRYELYGEGEIIIYLDGDPYRIDERSIFTRFRWRSYTLY